MDRIKDLPKPLKRERGLFVSTADLVPYIEDWLRYGGTLQTLSENAVVGSKTVSNIYHGQTRVTTDEVADRLMIAMDLPHIKLEFVPKPVKPY